MNLAGHLRTGGALALCGIALTAPANAAVTGVTVGVNSTCPYGLIA